MSRKKQSKKGFVLGTKTKQTEKYTAYNPDTKTVAQLQKHLIKLTDTLNKRIASVDKNKDKYASSNFAFKVDRMRKNYSDSFTKTGRIKQNFKRMTKKQLISAIIKYTNLYTTKTPVQELKELKKNATHDKKATLLYNLRETDREKFNAIMNLTLNNKIFNFVGKQDGSPDKTERDFIDDAADEIDIGIFTQGVDKLLALYSSQQEDVQSESEFVNEYPDAKQLSFF